MGHNYFGIIFSGHHYIHPFTCPCEDENQSHDHSLTLFQKVAVFAMSILFAIPTYGIGAIPAFYILTAAFKARNSVWTVYDRDYPERDRFFLFIPDWWGIRVSHSQTSFRSYSEPAMPYNYNATPFRNKKYRAQDYGYGVNQTPATQDTNSRYVGRNRVYRQTPGMDANSRGSYAYATHQIPVYYAYKNNAGH